MLLRRLDTVVCKGHQKFCSRRGDAAVELHPPHTHRLGASVCASTGAPAWSIYTVRLVSADLVPPLLLSGPEQGSLVNTLREVEPTSHMGVPRVWEKIMEGIQEVAAQSGFIRRKMLLWAMSVTLEQNLTCPSE